MNNIARDEFLYSSEYLCQICDVHHRVSAWSGDTSDPDVDPYYITDSDGDVVASYTTLEEMEADFPEGTPNSQIELPKYKSVRWYAVINSDFTVQSVTDGNWANSRGYIPASDAPHYVRQVLSLPDNPEDGNRMSEEIQSWADVEKGLAYIGGERVKYGNCLTSVIKFYAKERLV